MQPNRIGRLLGIGTRVAVGKLRDGAAGAAAAAQRSAAAQATAAPAGTRPTVRVDYPEGGRRVARGAGRFGSALVRPFAHATSVLMLQITGVFFALFTVFFAVHAWQAFKAVGAHDRHTLVYAAVALLFAWFTFTSFWRARTQQKRN